MDQNNESPNIVFEDEESQPLPPISVTSTQKMTVLIVKYSGGLITDEKQALYALLVMVVIAVVLSIFFALPNTPKSTTHHEPGDELLVPHSQTL